MWQAYNKRQMPLRPYSAYIFDLDGTLFRGEQPIVGAADTLRALADRGALIRYLTNNSTRSQSFYADKLRKMGFAAEPADVYSSAIGTARHLRDADLKSAYVIGEEGLRQTLADAGITITDSSPEAVVVGLSKGFDYNQMNLAMQLIRKGATFIATNTDATYPMEHGQFVPGSGSVVAAVSVCSETNPFVVGKPNPFLIELILEDVGLQPSEVLVVGDRRDTDIESGRRAGCDTCLVLTGHAQSGTDDEMWLQDVNGLV